MSLSDRLLAEGHRPHPRSLAGEYIFDKGVPRSMEFDRIKALPRRVLDLNKVEDLTPLFKSISQSCNTKRCHICTGGVRLLPIQSAMLWEAEQANGLFAAVGVGHGKTLASFLLPEVLNSKVSVLLIPPHLREKTAANLEMYGNHFNLPHDAIHVVAYSELSSASSADILEQYNPDLIIADEAHCLRHKDAARTKRFLRFMKAHPETRFCAMSGSMTDRSIKDYAHLIELALRKNSPLPRGYRELQDWAEALDVSDVPMPPGVLLELELGQGNWPLESTTELARHKFRNRLVQTAGVVATEEGAIGASLVIDARNPSVPSSVSDALKALEDTWEVGTASDGMEELVDAPSVARAARQMSLGFYYRWDWPNGVKDEEWLTARANWHRAVRHVLKYMSKPGLDSPMLVANAAARGELHKDELQAWQGWEAVKDRPQPPTVAVWIDDFAARKASEWAMFALGIVWCEQSAFGDKVAELSGLPYYAGGAGEAVREEKGDRSVILSIKAHSEGHDHLSVFSRNLVTCPPSNAKVWEQMLGRTHRKGQRSEEVRVEVFAHTEPMKAALRSALEGARYIEQTQGQKQKLLYADMLIEVGE